MRQPHDIRSSRGSSVTSANAPAASKLPTETPSGAKLPQKPRCFGGAFSTRKITAPPYSAPAPNPCTTRIATSSAGAQ